MGVTLNIDSCFWGDMSGKTRIFEIEGKTVAECLTRLVEKEPTIKPAVFEKSGELAAIAILLVNQVPLFMRRLDKEVKDGDEISVIYGGGS